MSAALLLALMSTVSPLAELPTCDFNLQRGKAIKTDKTCSVNVAPHQVLWPSNDHRNRLDMELSATRNTQSFHFLLDGSALRVPTRNDYFRLFELALESSNPQTRSVVAFEVARMTGENRTRVRLVQETIGATLAVTQSTLRSIDSTGLCLNVVGDWSRNDNRGEPGRMTLVAIPADCTTFEPAVTGGEQLDLLVNGQATRLSIGALRYHGNVSTSSDAGLAQLVLFAPVLENPQPPVNPLSP